jgi:hypothetical protein
MYVTISYNYYSLFFISYLRNAPSDLKLTRSLPSLILMKNKILRITLLSLYLINYTPHIKTHNLKDRKTQKKIK